MNYDRVNQDSGFDKNYFRRFLLFYWFKPYQNYGDQIPMGIPSLYEDLITDIVQESDKASRVLGFHIDSEADLLTGLNFGVLSSCK